MSLQGAHIHLDIHRNWYENEKQLAQRLADIVVGRESYYEPTQKDNGSWQLDSGNNWFFFLKGSQGVLHTRYWTAEDLVVLDAILTKLLG